MMDELHAVPATTTIQRGSAVRIKYPSSVLADNIIIGVADGEPDRTGRVVVTCRDGSRREVMLHEITIS